MDDLERTYRSRPWRARAIAGDFDLEDVWSFELGGAPRDIRDFLACFWGAFGVLGAGRLARARLRIGRALRWDEDDLTLAIPGCEEATVSARLTDDDRERSLAPADAPSPVPTPKVNTVYVFPDEALYEISNRTIHALLHVALDGPRAILAVHVKHRGLASRLYMAAIWPARHLVLYPAIVREIERAWRRRALPTGADSRDRTSSRGHRRDRKTGFTR